MSPFRIGLALAVLAFILTGCPSGQKPASPPPPVVAPQGDLYAYRVGSPVLYLTCPLEMKLSNMDISNAARKAVEEGKVLKYEDPENWPLTITIHFIQYSSSIEPDVVQASAGAMMALQNRPGTDDYNFETSQEESSNYGKTHKTFFGTFSQDSTTLSVAHHTFVEGNKLWQLEFVYYQEDPEQVTLVHNTLTSIRFEKEEIVE